MNLFDVYEKVNKCVKCSLCKNRITNCSFRGSEKSQIMVIGESFGKNEQLLGKPFVGRSGKLFDGICKKLQISPEIDLYITNLVKDRPIDYITGKDRKPFYDEIVICAPYLMEEIEILKPRLIITLGKTSGDWFANYNKYEINHYYLERKWLALYHPSYLLRNRNEIPKFMKALKEVIENFKCLN